MQYATGRLPLVANRWAPFVHELRFEGLDLTGGTFDAAVRATPDGVGAPAIVLATTTGTGEGIKLLSVATEAVDFGEAGVLTVPVSTLQITINETTLEGQPFPGERGVDLDWFWDMQITATGIPKYRALEGPFTIHAGATGSGS